MSAPRPDRSDLVLAVVPVADIDEQPPEDRWLIEGLWGLSAIGVLGGPPKCFKTWMALDMAVAVASGTDALGHFPVARRGAALVYLAEDSLPQVRGRVGALCRGRGIEMRGLSLHVITEPSLRLDVEHDLCRLAATIEALRPRLVVLDPLVRLHRPGENSASEISGLLSGIRDLQRRFDVAITIVHHASKKARAHPGQALRGSGDLHALGDSNAYLARQGQGIVLMIEQRAARSPEPMWLELLADEEGRSARLRARPFDDRARDRTKDLEDTIIDRLEQATAPLTRGQLRQRIGVNNQRLGDALARMLDLGQIDRVALGLVLRSRRTELERMPGETEDGSAGAQPSEG